MFWFIDCLITLNDKSWVPRYNFARMSVCNCGVSVIEKGAGWDEEFKSCANGCVTVYGEDNIFRIYFGR